MTRKNRKNKGKRSSKLPFPALLAVLGGVLLIGAGLWFFPRQSNASTEVDGAPSLVADREQIDFGDVQYNQLVEASFELTNVGDGTLRFTQAPYVELKAGC
jgi:hypothetical protein